MNEANNLQTPTQPPLVIADVSRCPLSVVYMEDCVQGLKRYADNHFDLAIVDPPYGIEIAEWDKERPTDEYWEQLFRVSKNQIVWGGNYFNLPIKRQWICWDKSVIKAGYLGKREFDEFELAWTSFDGKCKMIRFSDIGNMNIELIKGNCLIESNKIKDGSVDLILTDLPYGTMRGINETFVGYGRKEHDGHLWDFAIEPKKIYEIANRILRKNGKMVLFSQEPYTSKMINDAIANIPLNYRMIWEKNDFANALIAKKAPVSFFEDIIVFSKKHEFEGLHPLRPYFKEVFEYIGHTKKTILEQVGQKADHVFIFNSSQFDLCTVETYEALIYFYCIDNMSGFKNFTELKAIDEQFKNEFGSTFNLWEGGKFKSNILKYKKDYTGYHPTQKPILLLEDLIKTFSNENDLVVDLTMGSCSTGIACINTNRNFIGIELDENYFNISKKRVEEKRKEKDLQDGTLFGNEM